MKMRFFLTLGFFCCIVLSSCNKDNEPLSNSTGSEPKLIFKFVFDSTQVRLGNLGQPAIIADGNAAQSPKFNSISQHYIELAGDWDTLGGGEVIYVGAETTAGGPSAINHHASIMTGNNEVFYSKPLNEITPGSYKWLRVSLAYQNYDIKFKYENMFASGTAIGTLASFIGYRTYIDSYTINGTNYSPLINSGVGNHPQGYWGFQTTILGQSIFLEGQAPEGATTVPNPLFASSPIPQGSCVVTGQFVNNGHSHSPLIITGSETQDIVITVSLSTNNSFEWQEVIEDGLFQPDENEHVVDMGIRGMIPIKN